MRAIIYSRVSSTTDRQNTDRQICDLKKYAECNGMEVIRTFSEKISGAKVNSERMVLNECLHYAKLEGVDYILFSELSRLGRNILQVQEIIKWFSDNKVNAYFDKEKLTILNEDGEITPTTNILISCLSMVAQIERDNIKYRLNSGRERAKDIGIKMGRKVGSVETQEDKKEKYPITISLLRKGYKLTDVLTISVSRGEKVSMSTIKRLRKHVS